jgi:hypothetical protein
MSLGYVGHAQLEVEDTEIAIYSYAGENWNVQDEAIRKRLASTIGQLTIDKSCLIEPELHSTVRKMPNGGKKLVEKIIVRHPDISELISDGSIVVDGLCSVDAEASDYRPRIYMRLLRIIFESYQLNGRLPEKEGLIF